MLLLNFDMTPEREGMLLGNCINGVSLSLNVFLTSLVESSREVELFLSFGASSYEASSRLLREAVRTGAMPQLNSMAIIGIISIPGMMTGETIRTQV
jgi:putative ABC transport system permease protein